MALQKITFEIQNDVTNAVDAEGCRVFTAVSPNGSVCILTVTPVSNPPVLRTEEIKNRKTGVKETVKWLQQSLIGGFQKPRIAIGDEGYTITLKVNKQMPREERKAEKSNGQLVSI